MILVTGGAGYIGSVLVPKLLLQGHAVRVVDRLFFGDEGLKPILDAKNPLQLVVRDFRKVGPAEIDGVETVIHLAGLSNDPTADMWPEENMAVNAHGTRTFGRLCAECGVKLFIFGSTASIYDRGLDPSPALCSEKDEVNPVRHYSKSKLVGEEALLAIADEFPSFKPVIFRQATLFGWSPRMRFDLAVNQMALDAVTKGVINVFNGGKVWRPMVSVEDLCDAYLTIMASGEAVKGPMIVNVLRDNYLILELAHAIKNSLQRIGVSVNVEMSPEFSGVRNYRMSADVATGLGIVPKQNPEDGAALIAEILKKDVRWLFPGPQLRARNIEWMKVLEEAKRIMVIGSVP